MSPQQPQQPKQPNVLNQIKNEVQQLNTNVKKLRDEIKKEIEYIENFGKLEGRLSNNLNSMEKVVKELEIDLSRILNEIKSSGGEHEIKKLNEAFGDLILNSVDILKKEYSNMASEVNAIFKNEVLLEKSEKKLKYVETKIEDLLKQFDKLVSQLGNMLFQGILVAQNKNIQSLIKIKNNLEKIKNKL